MKLKEIIQHHRWLSVETTLLQCYPDQQKNVDGYRKAHEILLQLPSADTAMQLQICWVADEDPTKQGYHDVSGLEPDEAIAYSIEFRPWAEWLGMAVTEETYAAYTELEITAHCLFEMTFAGLMKRPSKKSGMKSSGRLKSWRICRKKNGRSVCLPWMS